MERVERKIDFLTDLIETSLLTTGTEPIDVKQVAKRSGVKVSAIYSDRYRHYLPYWGVSSYKEGRKRWPIDVYLKWISIPIDIRRESWSLIDLELKEKIVMGNDINKEVRSYLDCFIKDHSDYNRE